jgi:hypothetical protein
MLDAQALIDSIRSILASAGPTSVDSIAEVAAEYAEACQQANERLRKCGQLLKNGLRSEAIQQCESEPSLLVLVGTLDFPEAIDWNFLLQSTGIETAAPLLVDVAADLNEAYAVEQPLAALLRRHRLQALRRGPLRERLATLRQLATLDANNAVWQDDVRAYEQARQQEIRQAVDQGTKQRSLKTLEECARDLQIDPWLDPPPAALVQHVINAHQRVMHQHARSELERLEPLLNDAFAQFDEPAAQTLREEWNRHAETVQLSDEDPLYDRAAPAIEWLNRQDGEAMEDARYKGAVAELEQALDDEEDLASLERKAHAILRCERPIPPLIEQRLKNQLDELRLTRTRKTRLAVGAVAALLLVAGCGLAYAIYMQRQIDQVAGHATTLQTFLERNQLDEAHQHFQQLMVTAPAVAAHADIQKLGVDLAARRRDEQKRIADFTTAVDAAEQAGTAEPDRKAVEMAAGLAVSDAEKARVLKLQNAIATVDLKRQAERDKQFLAKLQDIRTGIDALNANNPEPKQLAALRTRLADLVTKSVEISPAALGQAKAVQQRVETFYELLRRRDMTQSSFKELDAAVGDVAGFRDALLRFVEKLPNAPQAVDFKRVAGESMLWEEVESWNQFAKTWRDRDVTRLNPTQAADLLKACTEFVRDHSGIPEAAEVKGRIPHLEAILRREGTDGKLHAPLNELFTDPMIATLWMVEAVDGKGEESRYYMVSPPPEIEGNQASVQIAYINDFARVASKQIRLRLVDIKFSGQAPQSIVAKQALDELAKINSGLWESVFAKIIGMIASDSKLDPILKVILLQRVLEVACEGSESLRSAFATYRELLGSVAIDPSVPWMDLKNEDTRRTRELASELLHRLPPYQEVVKQAAANLTSFKSALGPEYHWVGWLDRSVEGKWQCRVPHGLQADGELLVVQPKDTGKEFQWAPVGRVKSTQVEMGSHNPRVFVPGRPVYLRRTE